jgi:leucyl aminopeptidase (aminopeptidase T)
VTDPAELERALDTVVRRCLGVRVSEEVLVVADPASLELAGAFRDHARVAGAEAVLALMEQRADHGAEPPATVAAALVACDVFIAPTSKSLSHTRAREAANEAGARGATLPQVTADMLARLMAVEFDALARRAQAVARLLDDADEARISCPRGTDLHLDLSGRRGLADDGDLTAPGAFGNLPCGEGFIAPRGGEGRVMASTLVMGGVAPAPVPLVVERGRLARAEGEEGERFLAHLERHGAPGLNLAELGVGTNDRARLSGNVLEDEKILGTIHVAFGDSAGFGGDVSAGIHEDVVVLDPTLDVGATRVLDGGRWAL